MVIIVIKLIIVTINNPRQAIDLEILWDAQADLSSSYVVTIKVKLFPVYSIYRLVSTLSAEDISQ